MRWFAFLLLLLPLTLTGLADSAPVKAVPGRAMKLLPYRSLSFVVEFEKEARANVIIIGNGRTPLGLYVYDPEGNCVARDDQSSGKIIDDNAVIWYPTVTQRYRIEIRNMGGLENTVKIFVR
jgi:hypothetical protein